MPKAAHSIRDWRSPIGYESDILKRAKSENERNYEAFMRPFTRRQIREFIPEEVLWRWEFLRRLPEYQREWESLRPGVGVAHAKYGLYNCRPDPTILCPPNLVFLDLKRELSLPFMHYLIDIRYPVRKTLAEIDKVIQHFRKISRIRQRTWPSVSAFPKLLRTIDACHDGASIKDIGKKIFLTRSHQRVKANIKLAQGVQSMITKYQAQE